MATRAAEAGREEKRAKLRRGERVAPTRATVAEYAPAWLEAQVNLRPRTIEKYRGAIDVHIIPRLGRLRLGDVSEEHIALLVADMQREGYAGWTIRGILTPLGRILGHAARRGVIAANPVSRLERGERPVVGRRDQRVLDRGEIAEILNGAVPKFRPLIATAVFTGLRLGELLGLVWGDIDREQGFVRVRKQLDRDGTRVEPKTPQAKRDVVLYYEERRLVDPPNSIRDSNDVRSGRLTALERVHFRRMAR